MVIDKNYFLTRLQSGEDIDTIGQDIANMMNAAMADHQAALEAEKAAQAARETENAKRELVAEMIDIIKELAILEGIDESELEIDDADIDALVKMFTETFALLRQVKKLEHKIATMPAPASGKIQSDDEVLANFIKMFS